MRCREESWSLEIRLASCLISLDFFFQLYFSLLAEWPSCIEGLEGYKYPHSSFCKVFCQFEYNLRIILNSLKSLVLYPKCGNLGGVLGLFVSIRWCFCILIDPKRLPKCSTRVVFLYLLKNTCLYLIVSTHSLTAPKPCVWLVSRAVAHAQFLSTPLFPAAKLCLLRTAVLLPVHTFLPGCSFLDLGSLSVVYLEFVRLDTSSRATATGWFGEVISGSSRLVKIQSLKALNSW